ncbi:MULTISPECIES: hypothetical protein [unclassified Arsukibacterium]|uniref:hypothetical protein n=1 Tax=unclassified Arsukibacterium TaxID=2635278 RepID=UPI000C6BE9B9|nr:MULTISPECIES: hypothetical protein [unclassified Arsukibacterium]MAA96193.1 hypothetical protein [Rheinheimera sp.]MBM32932.1 hypothetical protein [Rheinheimera sp.]HAW92882.1 hypothetical protein [Candidatus Azambacteria bacterium]|tara:strand:- start:256 stop:552 length:297 start_codon:yes stop_codon:yes gene_type:complete
MKYQVVLRGENFQLMSEGKVKNLGFFTTRWVKAESVEDAEQQAVALIKRDDFLIAMMVDQPTLQPMIYLEEIAVAKWWKRVGGKGYSFWEMEPDAVAK